MSEVAPALEVDTSTAAPEPVAAAEPTAEPTPEPAPEPVAEATPEPTPEPIVFPNADEWGWDAWDGTADALPEEVRGWYGKFDERFTTQRTEWDTQRSELEAAQLKATQEAQRWKDIYNTVAVGEDDPRIAESLEQAAQAKAALEELQSTFDGYKADNDEYFKQQQDVYLGWVGETYPDQMAALNESEADMAAVLTMYEETDIQLHKAIEIWEHGPEAIEAAMDMAKKNVPEAYIFKYIKSQFTESKPSTRPKPPKSASVVAGATPTTAVSGVPDSRSLPKDANDRRLRAVEDALKGL